MSHTLGAAKVAAAKIGCDLDTYLARRAAGLGWCSCCRSWQPTTRRNTCRACNLDFLARARARRRALRPTLNQATVLAAYAASSTAEEMATRLQCSARTARRLVLQHGLQPFRFAVPQPKAPHPPQRWCSCEWCVRARGRAA